MSYSRVLLKLSGEALMGNQGYGIDPAIVQSIASDVAKVVARELGSPASVTDDSIMADVEKAFEFERSIAMVRKQ